MRARDLAYETALAFNANRGRSLLTILGIVIGISAVIAMTALIGGIKQSLMGDLGLEQARLVYISVYPGREVTTDDLDALSEALATSYEYLTPVSYGGAEVSSPTKQASASIQGVMPEYFTVMGSKFVSGHAFSADEEEAGALVAVIDQSGVRTLYGNADEPVVGESITIGNDAYTIVGVVESTSMYVSDSVQLYLPYSTLAARVTGYASVDQVLGFAREDADMDSIASITEGQLAAHFNIADEERENSMYIMTMKSMIDQVNATMGSFQILMTSVASISLLVGGIGIMNMMLTNVTERIREIGLRKALGARRHDITSQFLLESVCLCVVGGIIGIALGYAGSFALSGLAGGLFYGGEMESATITPVIDWSTVMLATGICVGIGVVFGFYPAWRASRLDPVESLHYQ